MGAMQRWRDARQRGTCTLCERLKPWQAHHACLTRLQDREGRIVVGAAANIAPGGVAAYQHLHGGRPL